MAARPAAEHTVRNDRRVCLFIMLIIKITRKPVTTLVESNHCSPLPKDSGQQMFGLQFPCVEPPSFMLGVERPRARQVLDDVAEGLVDGDLLCRTTPFYLARQHLTNFSDDVLVAD